MNVVGALLFARLFPTETWDYVSELKEKPKNASLVCFSYSQHFWSLWEQFGQASIIRPDNEDDDDDDGAR